MKIIARIRSDFPTKFGIPRQSGRVEELTARVVFEPEYRVREAVKGMEDFSHIWLLWEFSQAIRENWSPTVRPPRLGGNERMGVFATRRIFPVFPCRICTLYFIISPKKLCKIFDFIRYCAACRIYGTSYT